MIYLTYQIDFKNGSDERYMVEIEPHEYEKAYKEYLEIQAKLKNQFSLLSPSFISIEHSEGFAMFSTAQVSHVNVKGLEDLKYEVEN